MKNTELTLAEAFQSLKSLTEDVFEVDDDGIERANSFINDDIDDEANIVIDPLAQTEEDLQDSYLGKAILDCTICRSKIYKDPEEIIINEDGSLANVGEICPYCQSSDGFKVIGQVAPYEPVEEDEDDESEIEVEVDSDDDSAEVDIENKESLEESKNTNPRPNQRKPIFFTINRFKDGVRRDLSFYKEDTQYLKNDDEIKNYLKYLLDDLNALSYFDIPAKYANDPDNVTDKEAYSYFEYLIKRYNLVEVFKQILKENEETEDEDLDESVKNKNIKQSIWDKVEKYLKEDDLKEDLNNVSIETDKEKITVTSESKEEPIEDIETSETMIAPLDETTESEFKSESEETEYEDSDYEDIDVDEFEEESFNILGEKYLKKVYENVKSFKTTQGSIKGNSLKLEGLITFKSGKQAKTNFVFESKAVDKSGRMKLEGLNKQLAKGNKAFTLIGRMDGNKFLSESLTYNYTARDNKSGKSTRLYGRIK